MRCFFFLFREDGKDGLKFYTDPNYFFELWRQEMVKDTERMLHDRVKKVRLSLAKPVGWVRVHFSSHLMFDYLSLVTQDLLDHDFELVSQQL